MERDSLRAHRGALADLRAATEALAVVLRQHGERPGGSLRLALGSNPRCVILGRGAFDEAAGIGCVAYVASCPNGSTMLVTVIEHCRRQES